jgi:hypothetical protein
MPSRERRPVRSDRPVCCQHPGACSANDRAIIDLVGFQSHCRHHTGDDGASNVVSGKSFLVATKGRSPVLCLRRSLGMHLRLCRHRGCKKQIPSKLWRIVGRRSVVWGFTDPEQNMINSTDNDDAGAQFNNDVFGPDF